MLVLTNLKTRTARMLSNREVLFFYYDVVFFEMVFDIS